MSLHHELTGRSWDGGTRRWSSSDTIRYALGVGAGADDPTSELEFTTENSEGVVPAVLPTFAVTLPSSDASPPLGDLDPTQVLHTEQSLVLHGPLPNEGAASITSRLVGFFDQGTNALAVIESASTDARTGRRLADSRSSLLLRREGGFGGDPGPTPPQDRPTGTPDHVVVYRSRADQALLYRLSGDRNPVHSDPAIAARIGFERPFLHGLCTFGFAGRALLHSLAGGDPATFGAISARFTRPVFPGQELVTEIWERSDSAWFRVRSGRATVLDHGTFTKRITRPRQGGACTAR